MQCTHLIGFLTLISDIKQAKMYFIFKLSFLLHLNDQKDLHFQQDKKDVALHLHSLHLQLKS